MKSYVYDIILCNYESMISYFRTYEIIYMISYLISHVYDIICLHYATWQWYHGFETMISYYAVICWHIWCHISKNCTWYQIWYQDLVPYDMLVLTLIWCHSLSVNIWYSIIHILGWSSPLMITYIIGNVHMI